MADVSAHWAGRQVDLLMVWVWEKVDGGIEWVRAMGLLVERAL